MSRLTLASLLVAAVAFTSFLPAADAQAIDSRRALSSVVPELNVKLGYQLGPIGGWRQGEGGRSSGIGAVLESRIPLCAHRSRRYRR